MRATTKRVDDAADAIRLSRHPYAGQIQTVLRRAVSEAIDDEHFWAEAGKPHLRTFLKTTPLGIAILDLAEAILEDSPSTVKLR